MRFWNKIVCFSQHRTREEQYEKNGIWPNTSYSLVSHIEHEIAHEVTTKGTLLNLQLIINRSFSEIPNMNKAKHKQKPELRFQFCCSWFGIRPLFLNSTGTKVRVFMRNLPNNVTYQTRVAAKTDYCPKNSGRKSGRLKN